MFNLSGTEVVFLLLAGLVVLGPERLPGVVRSVGRVYSDIRKAAQGVERDLRESIGAPIEEMKNTAKSFVDEIDKTKNLFGVPDDEPSPPMRPERSLDPSVTGESGTDGEAPS